MFHNQTKSGDQDGEKKMNKLIGICLIGSIFLASNYVYNGSTTSVVTISGAIIKTQNTNKEKKYPRKSCPVCKGKGKYLSGDGIKMVDCGYCEPESKQNQEIEVLHPPVIIKSNDSNCANSNCRCKNCKCNKCGCLPSVE